MTGRRPVPRPPHLDGLDRYEPGMTADELRRVAGDIDVVKLASNENPLGPSPRALEAVRAMLAQVHRYPEGPARPLREALAARAGVASSQVVIGNGSTDLIDLLARAYLGPEDDAVIADGAFARFRQVVAARNGHARMVPMRDGRHDLPAMAAAVGPRTRLLFVANPNNPTGTWCSREEIEALLAVLPPHVLLVLDEAYFEFAREEPGYPDGVDCVKRGEHVVVLRTFSKAYGLAGLRVGYSIGPAEVATALDTIREPFNSNLLAQAAALAALGDDDHVRATVELTTRERTRVSRALAALGFRVLESLCNFVWVDVGRPGAELFRALLAHGVIVRPLGAYGMDRALRVSIGTEAENDRFLAVLRDLVAQPCAAAHRPRGLVIAIDGPSGAGKSTAGHALAERLGYTFLDTGAMYRALALAALRADVPTDDALALAALATRVRIALARGGREVRLDGEDVTAAVRTREVAVAASRVSVHTAVRRSLVAMQRELGREGGVVLDGRDIGTAVFPDAEVKFWVDADPGERAARRTAELAAAGVDADAAAIEREIRERDHLDSTRPDSPLARAQDAVPIDTGRLSKDEVLAAMLACVDRAVAMR